MDLMPAVAYTEPLPITDPRSLVDTRLPVPEPGPRDLLVEVRAVSVNPVDVKVRSGRPTDGPTVLGFDAAGVVVAVGSEVSRFAVGDEVFYAGTLGRAGSNARFQAVDERIVGPKPRTLDFAEAAALPLTSLTAAETLERLGVGPESTETLLVLPAAGGVGSVLVQLARATTGLRVVGTASRPESREWALAMGAHEVLDHSGDLAAQVAEVAPGGVDLLFSAASEGRVPLFAELLRPRGSVTVIDDPSSADVRPLKTKSLTWHWELMFTRPLFTTPDLDVQGALLTRVSELVDAGTLRTTLTTRLSGLDAATLREAHRLVETGRTIGKVVVEA